MFLSISCLQNSFRNSRCRLVLLPSCINWLKPGIKQLDTVSHVRKLRVKVTLELLFLSFFFRFQGNMSTQFGQCNILFFLFSGVCTLKATQYFFYSVYCFVFFRKARSLRFTDFMHNSTGQITRCLSIARKALAPCSFCPVLRFIDLCAVTKTRRLLRM